MIWRTVECECGHSQRYGLSPAFLEKNKMKQWRCPKCKLCRCRILPEGGLPDDGSISISLSDILFIWKYGKQAWQWILENTKYRGSKRAPTCPPHEWDDDGECCVKCGIKDWMT